MNESMDVTNTASSERINVAASVASNVQSSMNAEQLRAETVAHNL
jgi:hypothetical protein